jgi:dephospho-CoA kinase
MNNFYLIGLIGTIGSGKSTVRKMLEELGAYSIDADALAHVVMRRGTPTWREVVNTFGTDILKFNGRIDRRKLGARVFPDPQSLAKLETLVHPAVRNLTKDLLRQTQKPIVVIEAIKLVEAGMHQWCDALWAVDCKPAVQIERVMRTRHLSEAEARARLEAQGSFADKLRLATVVIDNNGPPSATRAQVENAWKQIQPGTARDKSAWLLDLPVAEAVAPPLIETPPPVEPAKPILPPMPDWAKSAPTVAPTPAIEHERVVVEPPVPAWARAVLELQVRRARRSDLEALSIALAKKEQRPTPFTREEILKRFGERGYRIALADQRIVALAAWEAENLVASVREIWAESAETATQALPRLFELIESEARELLCEIVLLIVEPGAPEYIVTQAQRSGYQREELDALHTLWRQAIQERMQPNDTLWGKRLREVITRPF